MFNPLKSSLTTNQVYPSQLQYQQNGFTPMCQNFMNSKNEYSPLMNINLQTQMRFQVYNNHHNPHSKSYSLPANFQDTNPQQFMQQNKPHQQQPPPPRSLNGDIPLPSGWELEKTSTGQAYYIK